MAKKPQTALETVTDKRRSPVLSLALGTALASALALLSIGAANASEFTVGLDQTRTLRLEKPAATLSVGNPAIADVTVQDGQLLFVLGRSFGRTNLVALDNTGQTILDMTISVTKTADGTVTVYRGNRQMSYNCVPNCERALVPGDANDDFDALSAQINKKVEIGRSVNQRQ